MPEEAEQLEEEAFALMPHLKITELLLEVDQWTDFYASLYALDGAQRNRGLFTIFSDALHYDVPAQFPPGWSQAPANHKGGISVKTPRFFPVPI